ncbi:4-hydroxyphenylacetate 3-hydroxylase N-terminal domain-containing protein [Haliea salexigens]|uniref:4-hydroxyphenylacetate 3-hydroxylase N-terminal domain-containing protein n=1 Tax=Haliea salexigens TaxID=287487 RepID=UPI00040B2AED|nr:4-hydroxyphenylacetate 3-hydroxylase N-terminal domain-containing protein [Haliea salexigens]
MGIKTGKEYKESLRDNRQLFVDGKLVTDVTEYGPMQGVINTISGVYDQQHDSAYKDILTFASPATGDVVSKTYLEAKTEGELGQLSACYHLRTKTTFGLMGRLTDFMSAFLMDQVCALRAIGKTEAADKAQAIVDNCRENDLQVTHALIDPQTDRSKDDAPNEAVRVVERRDDGVVVSGCRMLSTLAPVANECYIGPYFPRKPGEEDFVLAFQLPMNAPGLSILARQTYDNGQNAFDRPLTTRFDEGDAILVFDNVFVPNERLIVNGDLEAYNGIMQYGAGYTGIQACTRSTMKLRFLTGMATAVARMNQRDKTPRFQAAIGELVGWVNVAEGIRTATLVDTQKRIQAYSEGKKAVVGDGVSEPVFQTASGYAALNFLFPLVNTKAVDVLRLAAGSGSLAPTEADYNRDDVGSMMDRYLVAQGVDSKGRLQLLKLAWDMTGTEFGSRQGLYERLYSGDPERNAMNWFKGPSTNDCESMIASFFSEQ